MKSMIAHKGHEGKEGSDFGLSSRPSCTLCERLFWRYPALSSQESGVRSQESGVRSQESGVKSAAANQRMRGIGRHVKALNS
jgi:hypothetical protein